MRLTPRVLKVCFILYAVCQTFLLINIQFPKTHNFDEFHYIPSAKQFLALSPNQNWEHPPLGKLLMAIGVSLWGDRPIGWRFMNTVFGSLTLVGMYLLAFILFENETLALWVALLTLFNQLLYVQSRIGMLDTFMVAFLIWGMIYFCSTWRLGLSSNELKKYFKFMGIFFGLAMACKWFAIVPWLACLALFSMVRLLQKWKTQFQKATPDDWYRPDLWKNLLWKDFFISLGVVPIGVYFLTFSPFLFVPGAITSLLDPLLMQIRMWEGQLRVVTAHPYMSQWIDWPLITRPIWYAFDREGDQQEWVRGVLLVGNPLVMWTGLLAVFYCAWDWIQNRHYKAFFIVFFYFIFYFSWAVIPRKISFYYYYYPAGLMLSLALAYAFQEIFFTGKKKELPKIQWTYLGVAACLFIYFFPILAALKIPSDSFRNWMWFASWI